MLYFTGDDRFGALGVSLSREAYVPRHQGPLPQLSDVQALHDSVQRVLTGEKVDERQRRLLAPGMLGGARPKALIEIDGSQWVLKFSEEDQDGGAVPPPGLQHPDRQHGRSRKEPRAARAAGPAVRALACIRRAAHGAVPGIPVDDRKKNGRPPKDRGCSPKPPFSCPADSSAMDHELPRDRAAGGRHGHANSRDQWLRTSLSLAAIA